MGEYINADELKQVMQDLSLIGDNCNQVDEFMAMVDLDNSGLISEQEFLRLRQIGRICAMICTASVCTKALLR